MAGEAHQVGVFGALPLASLHVVGFRRALQHALKIAQEAGPPVAHARQGGARDEIGGLESEVLNLRDNTPQAMKLARECKMLRLLASPVLAYILPPQPHHPLRSAAPPPPQPSPPPAAAAAGRRQSSTQWLTYPPGTRG